MENEEEKKISKKDGTKPFWAVTHYFRQWRIHKNMTAHELAEASGLTGSYISQLENGRCRYTQNSLEKVAFGLGVEPWMLLAFDPEADGPSLPFWGPVENRAFWRAIPEDKRDLVAKHLKATVEASRRQAIASALDLVAEAKAAERVKQAIDPFVVGTTVKT